MKLVGRELDEKISKTQVEQISCYTIKVDNVYIGRV